MKNCITSARLWTAGASKRYSGSDHYKLSKYWAGASPHLSGYWSCLCVCEHRLGGSCFRWSERGHCAAQRPADGTEGQCDLICWSCTCPTRGGDRFCLPYHLSCGCGALLSQCIKKQKLSLMRIWVRKLSTVWRLKTFLWSWLSTVKATTCMKSAVKPT